MCTFAHVLDSSQNYLVDLEKETCTCPDHGRGHTCKHLLAAVLLERGEHYAKAQPIKPNKVQTRV